jgi:hypothetical protein
VVKKPKKINLTGKVTDENIPVEGLEEDIPDGYCAINEP